MLKTKNKLFAAGAMLMVSVIMLSTASFAWFTISTAPEIKGMTANVTANGNLEIALDKGYTAATVPASTVSDAGNNETWGNLVNLTDTLATADITLKPVELTEGTSAVFKVPKYGTDGRVSQLDALTNPDDAKGVVTYNKSTTPYAFRVDFWLRTNTEGKISLSTAADVDKNATTANAGLGSYVTNKNITVKFQVNDGATYIAPTRTDGTDGDEGKVMLSGDIITIDSSNVNKPVKVSAYIYMDGTGLTNADAMLTAVADAGINIQFKHSVDLTPMVP